SDLREQGYTTTPPTVLSPTRMAEFAERQGLVCTGDEGVFLANPECNRLFAVQQLYQTTKDRGTYITVLLVAVLFACMFAFGSFTHRASRNLLTLKSKGQRFSPEKSVFWFFIPVFNLVKPWQIYREIFKGSDPTVSTHDELAWKTEGKVPAIVHVWVGIFLGVFIFNWLTIRTVWYPVRTTIDDVVIAHQRLIIADLLLAVLGVAAILVAIELNRRQEARHDLVGDITVTPPGPVDPLEEALKEGIRRKELENRRSRPR
ncbi:MAG: DUF4328 domain-containing protein, partial [Dehalococcoidia bacterium]|nr:DUF4328 domain-containing protein [Dehalococcoidia bacterium]